MNLINALKGRSAAVVKYNWPIVFFLLLYLLFPTQNPSLDSWGYACSIKYGTELFTPHHLLYNVFIHLLFLAEKSVFPDAEALILGNAVNGLFAAGALLFFMKIMENQVPDRKTVTGWVILAGSCFGVLRFATENETYIIPLFLSAAGSYYLIRQKYFTSGFLMAAACLFHQIHFLWWLAVFIVLLASKNFKSAFHYTLPGVTVPVSYLLVIVFYYHHSLSISSFVSFIFSDYLNGSAETGIDVKNALLLTPISFIRSFVQVHGNIWYLIKEYPVLIIPAILLLISAGLFLRKVKVFPLYLSQFQKAMGLAFALHLVFAGYSAGNSEFMVMLPWLLIISVGPFFQTTSGNIFALAVTLLIWNFSAGILPSNLFVWKDTNKLTKHMNNHPQAVYVLNDYWKVYNQYVYFYGKMHAYTLSSQKIVGCADCFRKELNNRLEQNQTVLTDCMNEDETINRRNLMDQKADIKFWENFTLKVSDTLKGKWSLQIVYQVLPKNR